MDFLNNPNLQPMRILKIAGIVLAAIIILAIGLAVLGSMWTMGTGVMHSVTQSGYGGGSYASYDYAAPEMYNMKAQSASGMPSLSARNVTGSIANVIMPTTPSTTGSDAEAYEVAQYSASYETRHREDTCNAIMALKSREDVIFENSNSYDSGCNFTFKVKHESVDGVLAQLKQLGPKTMSENIETIKAQVDDYTKEVDVLQKKKDSIDQTLTSALAAYDDITSLARRTENADALAKIIDSKVNTIEKLTQERININEQLDRLARSKADQLDRLNYTYFNVSVYENKFVDWKQIGDSWKQSVRDFVNNFNTILLGVTVNLLIVALRIVQIGIYALVALFVVKYGWKIGKTIWLR